MSNRLPQYSMSGGDSNNSGQHASRISYSMLNMIQSGSTTDPLAAITAPVIDPDSGQPMDISPDTSYSTSSTIAMQTARDVQHMHDVDNTGATIEVITVEKYKRTDGFANPYHIQGLNASTPDDVDDEDDEEEEELEQDPLLVDDADFDSALDYQKGHMTVDVNDPDEVTLKQELDGDEMLAIPNPSNDPTMHYDSLPASSDSSVTSISPVMSVASSTAVHSQIITPRCETSRTDTTHLLQFTVERVISEENTDSQPSVEAPPDHSTQMSRVTPSDSMYNHEAEKLEEMASQNESKPTEPPVSNWIQTPASAQTEIPSWTQGEVGTTTGSSTAVATSVSTHVNGQPTGPPINIPTSHTYGVAPASNMPIMPMNNMMMPQGNELSNFPSSTPHVPVDMKPSYAASTETQSSLHPAFSATQSVVLERGSTPSPGPPTQPSVPSPPHLHPELLPQMTQGQSIDGSPPVVCESDDVEIRFRRARFLEKREQWVCGSILVVDTFRREEPATRPEINLPDPSFPFHCTRCARRYDGKAQKVRSCRCGNLSGHEINKILERYKYSEHKFKNHGFATERNKRPAQDHFDYPETIAVVQSASQLALIARHDNGSLGAAAVLSGATPDELRNRASVVAAAVASVSSPTSTQVNMSCTLPGSSSAISPLALRRNRLQRNNSHCLASSNTAQSSPSSFNANEFPEIDKLAAMAAATAVSMTAALSGSNLGDRGLRNERISESELDFPPVNPPTSPASGISRTSKMSHKSHSSVPVISSVPNPSVRQVESARSKLGTILDHGTPPGEFCISHLDGIPLTTVSPVGTFDSDFGQSNTTSVPLRLSHPEPTPAPAPSPALPMNGTEQRVGKMRVSPPPVDLPDESPAASSLPHSAQPPPTASTLQKQLPPQLTTMQPVKPVVGSTMPVQPQPTQHQQHLQQKTQPTPQVQPPPSQPTQPPQQAALAPPQQQQPQQTQQQQQQQQAQVPSQQQQQSSASHFTSVQQPADTSVATLAVNSSLGATFAPSQPVAGSNATEAAFAAAYAACGLMLQSGFNLPIVGGDSPAGAAVSAPNISNNASSVNYLDQYRMQQILPGAPASSAAARPDPLRQSIESSINKTMEVVRVALITQCRDYSEGLLYEVKQLKEELRSRGEECQNAVETVNRLREQIERDRAIIRENVPPERLLQLGHPYSSLVAIPPASAIPSITESANQAAPAPQAILSSMTPSQPTSQQSQPPTQQPQQPHPPSQPLTQHQSE